MQIHYNEVFNTYESCDQDINKSGRDIFLDGKKLSTIEDFITMLPIDRFGLPLSENATCGDFVRALFPNWEVFVGGENQLVICFDENGTRYDFDKRWWNTPHERNR